MTAKPFFLGMSRLIAIAFFAAGAWGLIVEGNLSAAPKPRPTPTPTPTPTATPTPTPTPSPAPSANAATNVTITSFTANWGSMSGATGYQLDVARNGSFGGNSFVSGYRNRDVGNVTSRSVTGLNANKTYYYRVRAYNASGNSGNSNSYSYVNADTYAVLYFFFNDTATTEIYTNSDCNTNSDRDTSIRRGRLQSRRWDTRR